MKNRRGYSPEVTPVNDYGMNYSIGVQVILASNKGKGWTVEDFDRLRGSDVSKVMLVGLNFLEPRPRSKRTRPPKGDPNLLRAIPRYPKRADGNASR